MPASKLALKILIVLTSHAQMGDTGHKTGVWMEELTTPYYAFKDAGAQVDIVSIDGGDVPIDPSSLAEKDRPASVSRFLADAKAMDRIHHSLKISAVSSKPYAAVYLPGGHGTLWDLPDNARLKALLSSAWSSGEVVAAVCHGPAGLLNVKDRAGRSILAGRRVAGFTNSEEIAAGLDHTVPFMLESSIRQRGAHYEKGPNFQSFAVRDGQLVTGQNPASSQEVARLILVATRKTD